MRLAVQVPEGAVDYWGKFVKLWMYIERNVIDHRLGGWRWVGFDTGAGPEHGRRRRPCGRTRGMKCCLCWTAWPCCARLSRGPRWQHQQRDAARGGRWFPRHGRHRIGKEHDAAKPVRRRQGWCKQVPQGGRLATCVGPGRSRSRSRNSTRRSPTIRHSGNVWSGRRLPMSSRRPCRVV